ncbi:MAG: hypothetical protein HRU24_00265 [Gammaproteobacteria bacterium]|nr:hypothetical protein [Gammaproteobacteria bacterium]
MNISQSIITSYPKLSGLIVLTSLLSLIAPDAISGARLKVNNDGYIDINLGLKASVLYAKNQAPNDIDDALDLDIESARLYLSGQIFSKLTFEFTGDYSNFSDADKNSDFQLIDASINYQFNPFINLKVGRFIRPGDRATQAGPYFSNTWDYPVVVAVNGVPPIIAGRDEGVALWGQTGVGKFKYYAGLFEGIKGGSNRSDSPLFAGRIEYNFWDPEPGYYNANAHYGAKDILAIGLSVQTQKNAIGNKVISDRVSSYAVDLLIEKVLDNSAVVTFEAALYDYDYHNLSLQQGDGYLVSSSYLLPAFQGSDNRFQLVARYQDFTQDPDIFGANPLHDNQRVEAGVHYIIKGHSAKLSVIFANQKMHGNDYDQVRLGVQFQTF